jgi:hypothetical protein
LRSNEKKLVAKEKKDQIGIIKMFIKKRKKKKDQMAQ